MDTHNIQLNNLCISPPGLQGLNRLSLAVVDAPCPSAQFTVWDQGRVGQTACVQCVIRDCTERLRRWYRKEQKLKWRETTLMWKRKEYDGVVLGFFLLEWLASSKMNFKGECRKEYITLLSEAEEKKCMRHLQGWTDGANVEMSLHIASLGVCEASLLLSNRAHLPSMLRIPLTNVGISK